MSINIPCLHNHTLFIENCENLNIFTCTKFNHMVILKSSHITVNNIHGLISGIDIIHSKNVNINIKYFPIYNITCMYSDTFIFNTDDTACNGILITTKNSYKVIFNIFDQHDIEIKKYITNMTYFPIPTLYQINIFNDNVCICFINETGDINYL